MNKEHEVQSKRTYLREPFSGISHLVGAVFSLIGLVVLLVLAQGKPWHLAGFAIFGMSLILLYTASTLYHCLHVSPKTQGHLQRFDHSAIFLLIAGTYAPVCLIPLRSDFGFRLLWIEYLIAVVGIASVIIWKSKPDWLRVVLYLGMGWLALTALPKLLHLLSPNGFAWLLAGGICYTLGTVFYATNRPCILPGKFEGHDIWHLFVMGGSTCHFFLMMTLVPFA